MNQGARADNVYIGTLGPGTTVVSNDTATVKRIVWGGTYVGTIEVYDSATAAGTTASNQVVVIGIPALRFPFSLEINYQCRNGIVVTESGTPTHRVFWGE